MHSRALGAERDAEGCLMEDVIAAIDHSIDRSTITDIPLDDRDRPTGLRLPQVRSASADHIIKHANFPRPLADQAVDDVRADQTRPAGD